jgi:hypothetical protein
MALGDGTHPGWMTRAESRELENLPPEIDTARTRARPGEQEEQ